jgi:hypothetical protein
VSPTALYALAFALLGGAIVSLGSAAVGFLGSTGLLWLSSLLSALALAAAIASVVRR